MIKPTYPVYRLPARAGAWIAGAVPLAVCWMPAVAGRIRTARRAWRRAGMLLAELAGVVLVSVGIAQWSWPSAVIIGGLVMVVAVELRPASAPRMPDIQPAETILRHQAENAAVVINNDRFGLAFADPDRLAKLTTQECEQLIVIARGLGVKT